MTRQSRQLAFDMLEMKNIKHFGGSYLKNHPKGKRPLTTKRSMHLVMRSLFAKGAQSFLRKDREIQALVNAQAKRFGVKIYRFANAGNHLHLVILPRSRNAYRAFIRSITGLMARLIMKSQRGTPLKKSFWEKRPFTRVVEWGKAFKTICDYLMQNTLEALGFIEYQPRREKDRIQFSSA
jgi:REP element-mobilizing transposase RayT